MYKNDLTDVLSTFSKREMMLFGKYLKSPYFNNRKRMIELFYVFKKFHPDFGNAKLTKEYISKILFNNKKMSDSTLRSTIHKLLILSLDFLKINTLNKISKEVDFNFPEELFQRGLYSLAERYYRKLNKLLSGNLQKDSYYYKNLSRIQTDNFHVNLLTKKVLKRSFAAKESEKLLNGVISLLNCFVLESLTQIKNHISYSNTYNLQKGRESAKDFLELFDFDKIFSYEKKYSGTKNGVIEVYYYMIKTYISFEDEYYYRQFKKLLLKNTRHFKKNDLNILYSRLLEYNILKFSKGINTNYDAEKEAFRILRVFIKREYYKTDSNIYLPFDLYRNVLIISLNLKKISYMENFIKTYLSKLLQEHIEAAGHYGYCLLYFGKKDFEKSLFYLNKIKVDAFIFKLDIKNFKVKIFYELGKFEESLTVLDTYKHFLKNTIVNNTRKISHNNFIEYISKLIYFRLGYKNLNIQELMSDEAKLRTTFDKWWINEKFAELKTNRSK